MHQPVFLHLAVDFLQVKPDRWYLDATFGGGGHTREILARAGRVVAFDYDKQAYSAGLVDFAAEIQSGRLLLVHRNFAQLTAALAQLPPLTGDSPLAGGLFDFGTNAQQLMSPDRGVSVYHNGPLDMRLDDTLQVTARDLLLGLSERELMTLFAQEGGEVEARKIARAVVFYRQKRGAQAFINSFELANLVSRVKKSSSRHLHPATQVFQALRIRVNNEIGNLESALPQAFAALQPGGRLVTIAFHEGEDRPVKLYFKSLAKQGQAQLLTKRPIVPDDQELQNPRARSAKLRCVQKL